MSDLVEFLRARLDDSAYEIKLAGPHPIAWLTYLNADGRVHYTTVAAAAYENAESGIWIVDGKEAPAPAYAKVIYDPARVLREVEVKRRLVFLHEPTVLRAGGGAAYFNTTTVCRSCEPPRMFPETAYPCDTIRLLALPYADHPDYREEWRP